MSDGKAPSENGRWLVREWAARLAGVLESMAGARPQVDWKPAAAGTPDHGATLWWEQSINAAEGARFFVGAPEESWTALGRHILGAAGIEGADAAEARSTFLELAGQSLEGLANAIGARLGREVVCPARAERPGPPISGECYLVDVNLEGLAPVLLVAVPGQELVGALAPPPQPAAPGQPASPASPEGSPMLDLLLDVELPVSISFGRTHLPLKEALKLTTGSIVELNRTVSEPVEIIVNNCVIARGEVVVIEGNYGVRIREIMSREARLSNLR